MIGVVLTFLAVLAPSSGVLLFQLMRDEAPKDLYGRVITAQQLLGGGLATAGPLLAGVLLATVGGTYLWLVLAGGCLLASVLTIRPPSASHRRGRDGGGSVDRHRAGHDALIRLGGVPGELTSVDLDQGR